MPEGCVHGPDTGRYFIVDDVDCKLVTSVPDHDDWHVWTEMGPDDEGEFWYVSDHEGYTLDAEEFGPFTDADVLTADQLKDMRVFDADAPAADDTPWGRGGDWCPWCGSDWKAEHEIGCQRPDNGS